MILIVVTSLNVIGRVILWPTVSLVGVSLGVDDTSLWLDHPPDFVRTLVLGDLADGEC